MPWYSQSGFVLNFVDTILISQRTIMIVLPVAFRETENERRSRMHFLPQISNT